MNIFKKIIEWSKESRRKEQEWIRKATRVKDLRFAVTQILSIAKVDDLKSINKDSPYVPTLLALIKEVNKLIGELYRDYPEKYKEE